MNLPINRGYLLGAWLEVKQRKWFSADFFLSYATIFLQSCLYFLVFRAVFLHSAKVDSEEVTIYYIVISIVAQTVSSGLYVAYNHMKAINSGGIIPYLLRPQSYPVAQYLGSLMQTVSHLLVNTALIFLVSVLFGRIMRLGSVCLGVLSTLLGFTILYLIQAVIGCCALWFRDITRFRDVVYTLLMMLGGRLIPSGMLFGGLKQAVYFTPLPYVYDVPVRVFLNQGASLRFLGVQLLWILLLGGAYWYLFHCHVRQNIEFGG